MRQAFVKFWSLDGNIEHQEVFNDEAVLKEFVLTLIENQVAFIVEFF